MRFGYEAAKKIASNPDPLFATTAARSAPAASSTASMSFACPSSESCSERPRGSERPDPLVSKRISRPKLARRRKTRS